MSGKISDMTAAAVADLGAATSDMETSINVTTVPATRRTTFQVLVDWLLQVGLLARMAPVTVTHAMSPYAVLATDSSIWCDLTAGAVTITLPAAPTAGRVLNVKKISTDGNLLTISRNTKNIEFAAADLTTASAARPNYTLQYDATSASWGIL